MVLNFFSYIYFFFFFFFFNDTATTEIYTLSLHDALPIRGSTSSGGTREPLPSDAPPAGQLPRQPARLLVVLDLPRPLRPLARRGSPGQRPTAAGAARRSLLRSGAAGLSVDGVRRLAA